MGPFKQKLSVSQNDWLLNHPGKTITIHDLAGIVTPAYNASFTPNNITAGFKKLGIYPFSRNAFTNDDFECAEVTNRTLEQISTTETTVTVDQASSDNNEPSAVGEQSANNSNSTQIPVKQPAPKASGSAVRNREPPTLIENAVLPEPICLPEMIRPFPKAPPRKEGSRGRRKGRSRILTESPEKIAIEAAYVERQKRLEKSGLRKIKTFQQGQQKLKAKRAKISKKDSSPKDTEEENYCFFDTDLELRDEDDVLLDTENINVDSLNPGDFCLVRCSSEKNNLSLVFVGRVEEKNFNVFTVTFLKKKPGFYKFFFPEKEDKWPVTAMDILAKLPPPNDAGSTSRTAGMITFRFDFSTFKLG